MKHRLFVAVDVPDVVVFEVGKLQQKLDKMRLPIVWENTGKLHITLSFLGRLADEEAGLMRRIITNTAAAFRPHLLQPVALETLYQRHEPSTIYLRVADREEELTSLQKELTRKFDDITPQPQKKFMPHIIIGRILKSDPTLVKQSIDKLSDVEMEPLSEFVVDKISLYESHLSKSGSSYQKLGSFNLGNKR